MTLLLRDWREVAACRGADPEIFFDPSRYCEALEYCEDCPAVQPCAEEAERWRRKFPLLQSKGVWGGKIDLPPAKLSADVVVRVMLSEVAPDGNWHGTADSLSLSLGVDSPRATYWLRRLREKGRLVQLEKGGAGGNPHSIYEIIA